MRATPWRFAGIATIIATFGAMVYRAFRGPDTVNGVPVTGFDHAMAAIISLAVIAAITLLVVYLASRGSDARGLSVQNAVIVGLLLECAQLVGALFPVTLTIDEAGVVSEAGGGPVRYAVELVAIPAAITMIVLFVSKRRRRAGF
jgi:hypothetical protein